MGRRGARERDELSSLAARRVPGFKCFLIHSGIDGFAWVDEPELRAALEQLKGTGLPLLAHAELAGPVNAATAGLNQADWRKYRPIWHRGPMKRRRKRSRY
jgi:allantoinase